MTHMYTTPDPTRISLTTDPLTKRMRGYAIHGNTPFDVPYISHIPTDTPFNLYQGGCEDGLILPENIKHVVSLYPWEKYTVEHDTYSWVEVVAYDSEGGADLAQIAALAHWVNVCLESGDTLVHCQAGLNRSSLLAAFVLWEQGLTGEEALQLIRESRSEACLCNKSFEAIVLGPHLN